MWGIIGTWEMVLKGIEMGGALLAKGQHVFDAIETTVKDVEANEAFVSVGYGGLPDESGVVTLDAAFMDGDTLSVGAVASLQDILHPVSVARSLMDGQFNNFLVGEGAKTYAIHKGFELGNLLTEDSKKKHLAHQAAVAEGLSPYNGHDTVCVVGLDCEERMACCTSTSGLFYKKPGRVGDSPIIGSGYYVDKHIGGAAATGLGEDIMKGCLSYEITMLMKTLSPQEACELAVKNLDAKLKERRGHAGDISVVAMNKMGAYGAATNIDRFPFVVMTEKDGLQCLEVNQKGEISCWKS